MHNAELWIMECLESVYNQTYDNLEVIIVDDGSTDGSAKIACEIAKNNTKIISQSKKGASESRNRAFAESRGDYIQYLDADDLLSPNKISAQISLLLNYPNKMAVCPTAFWGNGISFNNPVFSGEILIDTEDPIDFLIHLWGMGTNQIGMVQTNSWLTPRHIIENCGPWNPKLVFDEDGEFFTRALLQSQGVCVARQALNYYRKHFHNITWQNDIAAWQSREKALRSKECHLLEISQHPLLRKVLARHYFSLYRSSWQFYPRGVRECLDKAIDLDPSFTPDINRFYDAIQNLLGYEAAEMIARIKRIILNKFK